MFHRLILSAIVADVSAGLYFNGWFGTALETFAAPMSPYNYLSRVVGMHLLGYGLGAGGLLLVVGGLVSMTMLRVGATISAVTLALIVVGLCAPVIEELAGGGSLVEAFAGNYFGSALLFLPLTALHLEFTREPAVNPASVRG